jgi:hypothetical protein
MQARVVRAMLAALAVPRHRAGRIMIVRLRAGSGEEVHPDDRRHPAQVDREEHDADARDVVDRRVATHRERRRVSRRRPVTADLSNDPSGIIRPA